jgi:phage terminase large subunit
LLKIRLPHNGWRPRPHQLGLWSYLERGGKRASEIWHRRAGKDEVCLHWAAVAAHERPATYWHMLPEYAQGRKAIWNAVNPQTGRRRIDEAFPLALRANTHEQEMFIRFRNGSTWQVVGSDRYDSTVGSPPAGIVFSEWALANPAAWGYLAPIVVENNGWAIFITTSRGRNHAKSMHDKARTDPMWHAQTLTVNDTGLISAEIIKQQRAEYHAIFGEEAGDALIEQEYYCSFDAAVLGSFWGKLLADAEREGRICRVDIDRSLPVQKAWDIGIDDPMAIWCFQVRPGQVNVVDYYEASGHGFDHYAEWLAERGYTGTDWVPHDAKQREPGAPSGRSRIASMIAYGLKPKLVPDHNPIDRINAGRETIPKAYFDAQRCGPKGLEALREFKAEWNPDLRTFARTALHNWASHAGDAFGHLSVSWKEPIASEEAKPIRGTSEMTMEEAWRLAKARQPESRI